MTTFADVVGSMAWGSFILLLVCCTLWLATSAVRSFFRRFD